MLGFGDASPIPAKLQPNGLWISFECRYSKNRALNSMRNIQRFKEDEMSFQLFEHDTLFLQRFLRSAGFYTAKLDGVYGKKTDAAVFFVKRMGLVKSLFVEPA